MIFRVWRNAYLFIPLGRGGRGDSSGRCFVEDGGLWWPEWSSEASGHVAGDGIFLPKTLPEMMAEFLGIWVAYGGDAWLEFGYWSSWPEKNKNDRGASVLERERQNKTKKKMLGSLSVFCVLKIIFSRKSLLFSAENYCVLPLFFSPVFFTSISLCSALFPRKKISVLLLFLRPIPSVLCSQSRLLFIAEEPQSLAAIMFKISIKNN